MRASGETCREGASSPLPTESPLQEGPRGEEGRLERLGWRQRRCIRVNSEVRQDDREGKWHRREVGVGGRPFRRDRRKVEMRATNT